MKIFFITTSIVIIGVLFVLLQNCGEGLETGGSWSGCSCPPKYGHELRSMNLNFQESDITNLLKIKGYYGIEGEIGNCCGTYGEEELTGSSNSLELEKVNANNKFVVYSPKTYIVFGGVFLPNQWTLQFWLNPLLNTASGIIMEENIVNQKALFLSLTDDKKLSLNLPPSDNSVNTTHLTIESSRPLTANKWQYIAIVVSGNDVTFYIDGVLDKQKKIDESTYNSLKVRSSFSTGVKEICFGSCRSDTSEISFQGKADNIEFVHRTLSAGEILRNYQASKSTFQ